MEKKLTRKEKIAEQKRSGTAPNPTKKSAKSSAERKVRSMLALFIAVFSFLLYANTLQNRYALDDYGVVRENQITQKGFSGLGEIFSTTLRAGMKTPTSPVYRPLSKAIFAMEWELAPETPSLGHAVNALFFSFTCVFLFYLLLKLFKGNLLIPLLTSLLFAAHPIHTEVVANIKSLDEILYFLFCLLTTWWTLKYCESDKKTYLLYSAISFFLALLSKESAVTFLAVIPLTLYFFTETKVQKSAASISILVVVFLIFLVIRQNIIGTFETQNSIIDNSLVGIQDFALQKANAIFMLGIYLKQLLIPISLCSDGGYNHFPVVGYGDWRFLLPFGMFIFLTVYAIRGFRKKNLYAFGILYFFVTISIVSNIILLIGTNYAERVLYGPSLGFCLCIALLLQDLSKYIPAKETMDSLSKFFQAARKPIALTAVLLVLYGFKTTTRNLDWYDDLTLFSTDLEKVPESAHMHYYLASYLTDEKYLKEQPDSISRRISIDRAITELGEAIRIVPEYSDAFQRRGYCRLHMTGDTALAEADLLQSLKINPANPVTLNNLGSLCYYRGQYEESLQYYLKSYQYNPKFSMNSHNIASLYGNFGEMEERQAGVEPDLALRAEHLAKAKQNFELALKYFLIAVEVDPEYVEAFNAIGITYRKLGDEANADAYAMKAAELAKKKREAGK